MFNNTDLADPHIRACHYVSYLQRSDAATALVATSARPALSSPKCPSSLESSKAFSRETISRLTSGPEPPQAAEFLQKRLISEFFGFQWQNLAEILSLFKKYNYLRKVAVREKV